MKRLSFKKICEFLKANKDVKISTTWGWNVCKSSNVKIDPKKKKISIPAWSKWCGDFLLPLRMKEILSIEKVDS